MNMDNLLYYGEIAILGIGGLTVALNAIALVTPNDKDNKVAKALTWVNDKLQLFVLPFVRSKRQPKE